MCVQACYLMLTLLSICTYFVALLQELTAKEASGSLGRNERRHPAYKGSETTTVCQVSYYTALQDSHYAVMQMHYNIVSYTQHVSFSLSDAV
jgi:hypothetical protein